MKFKLILFDLGRVIFDYSWDNTASYWSEITGKPYEEIKSKFTFDDDIWHRFERGEEQPEAMRHFVNTQLKTDLTREQFENGCNAIYMQTREGIGELLSELKKDYKLAALSNTNAIHTPVWKRIYADVLCHFGKMFLSQEIGSRKPEPGIYQYVIDHYQIEPGEILFLDDIPINVDGARNAGMQAIRVISFDQMKADIEKALA
jgi:putative hydrolase of the HAD superfamily